MKKISRFLGFACAVSIACAGAGAQTTPDWNMNYAQVLPGGAAAAKNFLSSKALNEAGFELYQKQNYFNAYVLFKRATLVDPQNATAWYNRACTLGLLWAAGTQVPEQELFDSLNSSLSIDPSRTKKLTTDTDLRQVWKDSRLTALAKKYSGTATVYAAGDNNGPGFWKNGKWNGLGSTGRVGTIAIDGSDVYSGGYREDGGVPGYWKNREWVALNDKKLGGQVSSLAIRNGVVYAGGFVKYRLPQYRSYDSTPSLIPGYWKNGVWVGLYDENVSPGVESQDSNGNTYYYNAEGEVLGFYFDGDNVYAEGWMQAYQARYRQYGYWKNREWVNLAEKGLTDRVLSIVILDGNVYAMGKTGDSDKVAYWKNGELASSQGEQDFQNMVTIFGPVFSVINGNISIWKDKNWLPLSAAKPLDPDGGFQIVSYKMLAGTVYAGAIQSAVVGFADEIGAITKDSPGYWKNGKWTALPVLNPKNDARIYDLQVVFE